MKKVPAPMVKNNYGAFTLIEAVCLCAIVCVGLCAFQPLMRLYRLLHLYSAAEHMVSVCTYLAYAARVRGFKTRLTLLPPASYKVEEGKSDRFYDLSGGVTWAPHQNTVFVWDETGAKTAGTLRLQTSDGAVRLVTLTRAVHGPVRVKPLVPAE